MRKILVSKKKWPCTIEFWVMYPNSTKSERHSSTHMYDYIIILKYDYNNHVNEISYFVWRQLYIKKSGPQPEYGFIKKNSNMSLFDLKVSFECIYIIKFVLDRKIIYIYIYTYIYIHTHSINASSCLRGLRFGKRNNGNWQYIARK